MGDRLRGRGWAAQIDGGDLAGDEDGLPDTVGGGRAQGDGLADKGFGDADLLAVKADPATLLRGLPLSMLIRSDSP